MSFPGTSSQPSLQGSSVRTAGVSVQYLRLPGTFVAPRNRLRYTESALVKCVRMTHLAHGDGRGESLAQGHGGSLARWRDQAWEAIS